MEWGDDVVVGYGGSGADPTRIHTPAHLTHALRSLHLTAGQPSLRGIEQLAGSRGARLSRSTAGRVLRGDRLPSADTLRAFLSVCGVPAADVPAWMMARDRLRLADNARRVLGKPLPRYPDVAPARDDWRSDADTYAHMIAREIIPLAEQMLRDGSATRRRIPRPDPDGPGTAG